MPNIGNATPDGQYIIDTTPPGQSLNSAFVDVNLNFDQVWATGLVNSNIQIGNNTIYTTNVNGDLVLNPNGIGAVVANAHVLPDSTRIRNLGSPSLYWDSLYVWYGNIQSAAIATANIGNATIGNTIFGNIGNLTIPVGNLHILGGSNGFVLQTDGTGNLSWTAQTGSGNGNPGGANTQVQFNDAGAFAGVTAFSFDKTSNTLTVGNTVASNQLRALNGVVFNSRTITQGFTLDGYNAESVGPVDIAAGVDIQIINGDWVIL